MNWDWEYVADVLPRLLSGLWAAVQATFFGALIALVLGLVFAMLRRARTRWISTPTIIVIEFIRSTPLLVQLLFLFFVLPSFGIQMSAMVTGALALGVHYATYTSEVYRAGIDGVPAGQWEAATALNLPRKRIWISVILPQAFPRVIPALGNYLIALFKDVPQLVAITVVEPFTAAKGIIAGTFDPFVPFTLAGLIYLFTTLILSYVVRLIERRYGTVRAV